MKKRLKWELKKLKESDWATSYLRQSVSYDAAGGGGCGRNRVRGVIKKMSSWLKHEHWF